MKGLLFVVLAAGLDAATSQQAAELTRQASELYVQSRYTEAEPLYRSALQAWTEVGPEGRQNRALAMRDLGSLLRAVGRLEESEKLLRQSLGELDSPQARVQALWNLATLYRTRGDYPEAERYALRAIETAGENERRGPQLVLASVYVEQRRFEEAVPILLDLERGAEDGALVAIENNLAAIALARGNYAEAGRYAGKALDAGRNSLGPNHPAVAAAWNSLAQACRFQGRYLEAERSYRESIAAWERAFGPGHPNAAKVMMNLAALYHQREREAGAEELYSRAAVILETAYGRQYPAALVARNELADVLRAERRYSESAKLGEASLHILERALPADDPRVADALLNRAKLLRDTGHSAEASRLLVRINRANGYASAGLDTSVLPAADHTAGGLSIR